MATVTISLPDQIAQRVDSEAKKQGFATRSEFIRNLLRKYFSSVAEEFKFESFIPKPLAEIEEDLRSTGKYNEKFIKSVIRGLKENSTYYASKSSKS